MARNLIKAHDKIKGLEWTPTYFQPETEIPDQVSHSEKNQRPIPSSDPRLHGDGSGKG